MRHLTLLALSVPATAWAVPAVEVRSTCPSAGPGSIRITGATPGGRVALARSRGLGNFVLPAGTCAGTGTDLSGNPTLVQMLTADAAGEAVLRPSLPTSACDAALVAVDMTTCEASEAVLIAPHDQEVDFTRSTTHVYKVGYGLGTVATGWYLWNTGEYIEDTYTTSSLRDITGLTFQLPVDDGTSTYCSPPGLWPWTVSVNGVVVGEVQFPQGLTLGPTELYAAIGFPAVSAVPSPGGGTYTIRLTAASTICSGGGSYLWLAGGSTWLVE